MTTPTVKLVADVSPQLKAALDSKARAQGITRRAAVEAAINAYVAVKA